MAVIWDDEVKASSGVVWDDEVVSSGVKKPDVQSMIKGAKPMVKPESIVEQSRSPEATAPANLAGQMKGSEASVFAKPPRVDMSGVPKEKVTPGQMIKAPAEVVMDIAGGMASPFVYGIKAMHSLVGQAINGKFSLVEAAKETDKYMGQMQKLIEEGKYSVFDRSKIAESMTAITSAPFSLISEAIDDVLLPSQGEFREVNGEWVPVVDTPEYQNRAALLNMGKNIALIGLLSKGAFERAKSSLSKRGKILANVAKDKMDKGDVAGALNTYDKAMQGHDASVIDVIKEAAQDEVKDVLDKQEKRLKTVEQLKKERMESVEKLTEAETKKPKSAAESTKTLVDSKARLDAIKTITEDAGTNAEESAKAFSTVEGKIQELEALVTNIKKTGEAIGYGIGERKGKVQVPSEGKITDIRTLAKDKAVANVRQKIDQINKLQEDAEKATGMNLRSVYDKVIDDTIAALPKEVKDEVVKEQKPIEVKSAIGEKKPPVVPKVEEKPAPTDVQSVNIGKTEEPPAKPTEPRPEGEIPNKTKLRAYIDIKHPEAKLETKKALLEKISGNPKTVEKILNEIEGDSALFDEIRSRVQKKARAKAKFESLGEAAGYLRDKVKGVRDEMGAVQKPELDQKAIDALTYIAKHFIDKGTKFENFRKEMIAQYGAVVGQHLDDAWKKASGEKAPTFFSTSAKHIEANWPGVRPLESSEALRLVNQWEKKGSIAPEELPGIKEFIQSKKTISKPEIMDWVERNKVGVEVREHGAGALSKTFKQKQKILEDAGYTILFSEEQGIDVVDKNGITVWYDLTGKLEEAALFLDKEYKPVAAQYDQPKLRLPGGENYRERVFGVGRASVIDSLEKALKEADRDFDTFTAKMKDKYTGEYASGNWMKVATEEEVAKATELYRRTIDLSHYLEDARKQNPVQSDSHFPDVPNAIGWERVDERRIPLVKEDPRGPAKEIKFIDELQESEWTKEARAVKTDKSDYHVTYNDNVGQFVIERKDGTGIADLNGRPAIFYSEEGAYKEFEHWSPKATPQHPLLKQAKEVILKDSIRDAVDRGMEGLGWNTGEKVAKRYNLAEHVDEILVKKFPSQRYGLSLKLKDGSVKVLDSMPIEEVQNYVGKELSDKILKVEEGVPQRFSNLDLRTGAKWPFELYDKMIPKIIQELSDKNNWGLEIKDVKDSAGNTIHYAEFTDKLISDVQRVGLPIRGSKIKHTWVSEVEFNKALDYLRSTGERAYGGFDSKAIEALVKVAGYYIESAIKEPETFYRDMVEKFGEKVKPHLENAWKQAVGLHKDFETGKPLVMRLNPVAVRDELKNRPYIPEDKPQLDAILNRSEIKEKIAASDLIRKDYKPKSYDDISQSMFVDTRIDDMPPTLFNIDESKIMAELGESIQSPHNAFREALGDLSNPAVDATIKVNDILQNINNGNKIIKKIYTGMPSARGKILTTTKDLAEQAANIHKELQQNDWHRELGKLYGKLDKAKESGKIDKVTQIQNEINSHPATKRYNNLAIIEKAAMKRILEIAETEPSVRIALHAERKLPKELIEKMSEVEVGKAEAIRKLMDIYKGRLESAGIDTKFDYGINHLFDPHELMPKGTLINPEYWNISMRFPHRYGEMNWMPDVQTLLRKYIPSAERRISLQHLLNKWNPDVIEDIGKSHPRTARLIDKWLDANIRVDNSVGKRLADTIMAFEYTKDIGFSASVGFKHMLKLPTTIARQGYVEGLASTFESTVSLVGDALYNVGLKDTESLVHAIRRSTGITSKGIVKMLNENPSLREGVADLVTLVSRHPVTAIEMFENGVSALSEAVSKQAKGVPTNIIRREMVNSILRTNFRGGFDQPLIQKTTGARILTMFRMTPWKITENFYQNIKDALKGEEAHANITLLYDHDSGNWRPSYQRNARAELVRWVIAIGAMESLARANDSSVWEWMIHIPYLMDIFKPTKNPPGFKVDVRKAEWAVSPPIGKTLVVTPARIIKQIQDHGVDWDTVVNITEKDLGSFSKYYRAATGKIPKHYDDSALRYILGLESLE